MADSDPRTDFFKSMNEARLLDARAAIQAGLFINGLAATAILTFLGSVTPKIETASHAHVHGLKAFVWGLGFFAAGVFCGAAASLFSYLTNHAYAEANSPFDNRGDQYRLEAQQSASITHSLAYFTGLGTLLGFLAGVAAAIVGFDKLL